MDDGTILDDLDAGAWVLQGVESSSWLSRRVETIEFLDDRSLRRSITFDVQVMSSLQADGLIGPGRSQAFLTMLRKGLLDDFDLRDNAGNAVHTLTRSADSRLACQALYAAADRAGLRSDAVAVETHLYNIVFNFPDERDSEDNVGQLCSWRTSPSLRLDEAQAASWSRLLNDSLFRSLLVQLTFGFLLLADTPGVNQGQTQIFKLSYGSPYELDRPTFIERMLFRSHKVEILLPAMGDSPSSHVRIVGPPDVRMGSIELSGSTNGEMYSARLSAERAHLYGSSLTRGYYVATVGLRVPMAGALRAMLLSTAFATAVLWVGLAELHRLEGPGTSVEAAVALLLVAPGVVSVYFTNPGEHKVASFLLRPLRYVVAVISLLSFASAGVLLLGYAGIALEATWTGFAVVATLGFLAICASSLSETVSNRKMQVDKTENRWIVVAP